MKVADLQRQHGFAPIEPGRVNPRRHDIQPGQGPNQPAGPSFGDVLTETIREQTPLKFSAHAMRRIEENQMLMSPEEITRLENGVKQVEAKGAKDSLILVDDNAFIVSVTNKTVVTAINQARAMENVFTNIDSVAIV
jgi:flagellar operon protein